MRVTNNMLVQNMNHNLNQTLRTLDTLERKLATGKEVSRPSDDPARVSTALGLRNTVTEVKRYHANVDKAQSWLETYDVTLRNAENVLVRAKELAVSGGSGTLNQQARDAIAKEVDQLLDQAITLSNTDYQGKYIFAGLNTTAKPFTKGVNPTPPPPDMVTYSGDNGSMNWEISPGMTMTVNLTGQQVFVDTNIFDTLINLRENLSNGDLNAINTTTMQDIDDAITSMQSFFADLGAKVNRLDMTRARVEEQEVNYIKLLSETEDADIAKVIMDLKNQENVYRSSLAAGARVIQPTLIDFLQ